MQDTHTQQSTQQQWSFVFCSLCSLVQQTKKQTRIFGIPCSFDSNRCLFFHFVFHYRIYSLHDFSLLTSMHNRSHRIGIHLCELFEMFHFIHRKCKCIQYTIWISFSLQNLCFQAKEKYKNFEMLLNYLLVFRFSFIVCMLIWCVYVRKITNPYLMFGEFHFAKKKTNQTEFRIELLCASKWNVNDFYWKLSHWNFTQR